MSLVALPALARFETIRFIDPNPAPSPVTSFQLHVGANSGEFTAVFDIGLPPLDTEGARILALELSDDAIFRIAVSAEDGEGRSSLLSNEIERGPPGEAEVGEEIETWRLTPSLDCAGIASDDMDDDTIPDACDNCTLVANPDQRDGDAGADDNSSLTGLQRYGDVCDADLDNDGIVGVSDFSVEFQPCFGTLTNEAPECSRADFDADGVVGLIDFLLFFRPSFGLEPGPGYDETQ
jgi:hypothetical protein